MASTSHEGKKTSKPHSFNFERARFETSLGFLTRRFAELINRSSDRVLDLNLVAHELNAPKRRLYDVTNVLEGIHLIKKKSKNHIEWLGGQVNMKQGPELSDLIEEERKLDELIQTCILQVHQLCEDHQCQRFAYLTYEDVQRIPSLQEQTVIVIKAPAETKLEVPHPKESLQVHLCSTQGPIEVFLCTDDPIPMDTTDTSMANDSHSDSSASGKDSNSPSTYSSFVQVAVKDNANNTSAMNRINIPRPDPKQPSSRVTVTSVSSIPTSRQPHSEDQHSFVTLAPPLHGQDYLLSLAEDEGITDLFSADLEKLPTDVPLL
ncbi:transcription factor E2F3 [Echeneis naucrates]|uniref:transcription factor E2F3 n=1 Tax=Echeneis naucrates TaxID=173247 RepID=UPI0011146789|nr:transcription factor E2F3-like [Echeneis naucrates]